MIDAPLDDIKAALRDLSADNLAEGGRRLLAALGYKSDRVLRLSGSVDEFFDYVKDAPDGQQTQSELRFREEARAVHLLFQLTGKEIAAAVTGQQGLPLVADPGQFSKGDYNSFVFMAAQLHGDDYSRAQYAAYTREINRHLRMPVVALFRTANGRVSLSFVYRRKHKRAHRYVLGQVSMARQIDASNPHRAHLDILRVLSMPHRLIWTAENGREQNFAGLLSAWLYALDIQELNKKFYRELYDWFERALKEAKFPRKSPVPPEEHIIRLITRLLFIWFIKEKGLVAEDLFIENKAQALLKGYDLKRGDSYYRAVLQNLFFAVLNTEIDKRRFSKQNDDDHRDFSNYRYRDSMRDADALLALFNKSPFINGGLFDCLDSYEGERKGGRRVDCFTDNPHQRKGYSIPDRLFFDSGGLIELLRRYKFTVEENTPIEQEVALDPELLGKVFENLLAAYNPETSENARKQSGSFYTPRVVVDYMVDQSLLAMLKEKAAPEDGDADRWQERLQSLLDYESARADAPDLFSRKEREGLVRAIAEAKIIDPAVGSGAFPMGALHKLTLVLRRLDPDNRLWRAVQQRRATERADKTFGSKDSKQQRADALAEINELFERYSDSDFGRKLYLIQNGIFGVDAQTIACQIAKLRFFISLAIEQKPDESLENYGIKPLPNLETRFVAADALLGLQKPDRKGMALKDEVVKKIEAKIRANRERYFHATNRQKKRRCKDEDKVLRQELSDELRQGGWSDDSAGKIAAWDPYDQNTKADWFDAEYMFGVRDGFDIVIGNPPYAQLQKDGGKLGDLYEGEAYDTFTRTGDVYQLFYERGCRLLQSGNGLLCYITSNSWMKRLYGKSTRQFLGKQHKPLLLLEMGKDVFDHAIVDTNVLLLMEGVGQFACRSVDMDYLDDKAFPPSDDLWGRLNIIDDAWKTLTAVQSAIMGKMTKVGTPLRDWNLFIRRGVTTGRNEAFTIDRATRDKLVERTPASTDIIKPILRGRDVKRYQSLWADWWLVCMFPAWGLNMRDYPAVAEHLKRHKDKLQGRSTVRKGGNNWYETDSSVAYWEEFGKEKLFWADMTSHGRFAYQKSEMFCNDKAYIMTGDGLKYLCAILNSKLITWYAHCAAPTTGMGLTEWKVHFVERIPVPNIPKKEQAPFTNLVDAILAAKAADPKADTREQEAKIGTLVYALYGLTDKEIAIVECAYPA